MALTTPICLNKNLVTLPNFTDIGQEVRKV